MSAQDQSKRSPRNRRTQTERRAEAEEALLNAAAELFAAQGIPKTSLAAVCDHAGYSHGLVNHHFGSKQGLLEALAVRCQASFTASLPLKESQSGLQSIISLAQAYLDAFASPAPMTRCFVVMWGAAFVQQADISFAPADERGRVAISRWVKAGQRDGSISKAVDAEAFAGVLLAMLRGLGAQLLTSMDDLAMRRVKAECIRTVRAALT